ncbi:MAG: AAA-like domain-containing protein, partial [Cyanobacteriota bacterium]|nr:AAA-like domain-containing protein [Cyanobacteriota bacterium]
MTQNNPKNYNYYFRGSLPVESGTYVTRQADDLLFQNLQNANFSYVLNGSQMGKSSLMLRTKQKLEKNGVGCAIINLTDIGSQNITVSQWYRGLIEQIVDAMELEISWEKWWNKNQNKGISPVHMFGKFIRKALLPEVASSYGNAVIFVDEIERIIDLDFGTDDFFAFIRACHNKRAEFLPYNNLTFCLLGVATPSDLIADKTRTPFNIGTAIELNGFTFAEAKDALIPGLAEKVDRPEAVLKEVINWTGGQPFLTQKLCALIINNAESSNPNISQLVQTYIIDNWEGQDDPEHLRTIRDRLLRNEQNTSQLLGLYRQVLSSEVLADASPEQMELQLSGLVANRNGCLLVDNPIYRTIFNESWIEAELNKLRPYSESINAWLKSGRKDKSRLLRGEALEEVVEWRREKNLSKDDNDFITASHQLELVEQKQANQILEEAKAKAHSLILEIKEGSKLERAGNLALREFDRYQLQALISAMKTGQKLRAMVRDNRPLEEYPATSPLFALQQILATIKERNAYPHDAPVFSVNFSPDGQMLATASSDNSARLWDLSGNQIAEFVGHRGAVLSVSFSPDGKMLATASSDNSARLWDLSGNQIAEFVGHTDLVGSVSFSPDGKILATASRDSTTRLWNLSENHIAEFVGHTYWVTSVSFSPDGKILATASRDDTVRLWDLSGNQIAEFVGHTDSVWSVSFSPDGKILATASDDNTARLWDISGNQIAELVGHTESLLSVSFSPDGKMLATASDDETARLWDLSGNQIAELVGHTYWVYSVSFSPDGKMLATASDDETARLWDISGNCRAEFLGHTDSVLSVSFSPDGQILATASSDKTVRLWDLSGNQIAEFVGHRGAVYSVSFSPEGKMLATGSSDNSARLWDLSGNQIAKFVGHTNSVLSVSFSPDGKMLATASYDTTARLWRVENLEELLGRGCEWLQGYFVNHPEALAELEVCQG